MYAMALGYEKCRIINVNSGEIYKFKVPKDVSSFESIVEKFLIIKHYVDTINKELHMSTIPVYAKNAYIKSNEFSFPVQDMLSWATNDGDERETIQIKDDAKLADFLEKYKDIKLNPLIN